MKRLHVNLAVADLDRSIEFYSTLFASPPTVRKADYARWMLDDPRVNFSITTHGKRKGVDHLGIQVENHGELAEVYGRLESAGAPTVDEGATTCCYAHSEKRWVFDPEGLAWETFLTTGDSATYGDHAKIDRAAAASCCTPAQKTAADSGCC